MMTQIFQRLNIYQLDKKHILWALLESQLSCGPQRAFINEQVSSFIFCTSRMQLD